MLKAVIRDRNWPGITLSRNPKKIIVDKPVADKVFVKQQGKKRMNHLFKVGDRINTETLGCSITVFVKVARFFLLSFRKGRKEVSAVYQLTASSASTGQYGTEFLLVKLFGDKKMPPITRLACNTPLPCEVELIDHYNLAEHAIKYNGVTEENKTPVALDIAFALSL